MTARDEPTPKNPFEFIWNDGGRAASGFVGLTGDCVTRAIAIATGTAYRDVYRALGATEGNSPRNGVSTATAKAHLDQAGWQYHRGMKLPIHQSDLPAGVVVLHLLNKNGRKNRHLCTLVDRVIHDTWNPGDDDGFLVDAFWTPPAGTGGGQSLTPGPRSTASSQADQLTQDEFDRILARIRALDNTASNHASTEGEKRNALRMMQNLLLRHNLTRDDITEDDNVDSMQFTRIACPVNGRRAASWEKSLAAYLTNEIFPLSQWYFGRRGNRTLFWFYGPVDDVRNGLRLFRELLLTIATNAQLRYGGYSRGSGASYCEGYVAGLPRVGEAEGDTTAQPVSERSLIHTRSLAVHSAARQWLEQECGIALTMARGRGRDLHDDAAAGLGRQHGAKHDVRSQNGRPRLTSQ